MAVIAPAAIGGILGYIQGYALFGLMAPIAGGLWFAGIASIATAWRSMDALAAERQRRAQWRP